ncbi:hypothetical protein [Vibrio alginolyticus]|uniref:hypothetical protein n=1 Tax=Vibrio alginolyticus TaxID=663 RepID=UPI001BD36B21|nr:hypothetical protein [Vibrio alginolyticus]MBS9938678.1 hypothetical protein [Vibrio alginolyticus]
MSNVEPQILQLGQFQNGDVAIIVNQCDTAKNYTLDYGEYGSVTFTLIVGGEFKFVVGDKPPKIYMNDAEPFDGLRVTTN